MMKMSDNIWSYVRELLYMCPYSIPIQDADPKDQRTVLIPGEVRNDEWPRTLKLSTTASQ